MKRVLDSIKTETVGDNEYKLLEDFKYHVGSPDSDEVIYVRAETVTDFASVPRFAWSIVPPTGRIKPAALVHDDLYRFAGKVPIYDRNGNFKHFSEYTRRRCDQIFLEIMNVVGMKWHEKKLAYRAVRIGGWVGWNRAKKAMKKQEVKE